MNRERVFKGTIATLAAFLRCDRSRTEHNAILARSKELLAEKGAGAVLYQ